MQKKNPTICNYQHVALSYAEIMQMKWLWNGHLNRLSWAHFSESALVAKVSPNFQNEFKRFTSLNLIAFWSAPLFEELL